MVQREQRGAGLVEHPTTPIEAYELAAHYDASGLRVKISGTLAATERANGTSFAVDATIPWETLTLKGIWQAAAHWKFELKGKRALPSKIDTADGHRNGRPLGDLLIAQRLTWPYLKGRILFTPEVAWPPAQRRDTDQFLSIHFNSPW